MTVGSQQSVPEAIPRGIVIEFRQRKKKWFVRVVLFNGEWQGDLRALIGLSGGLPRLTG